VNEGLKSSDDRKGRRSLSNEQLQTINTEMISKPGCCPTKPARARKVEGKYKSRHSVDGVGAKLLPVVAHRCKRNLRDPPRTLRARRAGVSYYILYSWQRGVDVPGSSAPCAALFLLRQSCRLCSARVWRGTHAPPSVHARGRGQPEAALSIIRADSPFLRLPARRRRRHLGLG
jgi:hypothetical protein